MKTRKASTWQEIVQTLFFVGLLAGQMAGAQSAREMAASDFQHGRYAEAEVILRHLLKENPEDLNTLILLGPVLDAQSRYEEADSFYEHALILMPKSVQVLNNAANHFVKTGDADRAKALYRQLLSLDPSSANANLQMALMSVDEGRGEEALAFLGHVSKGARVEPQALMLRAKALGEVKRCSESGNLLRQLRVTSSSDPGWRFSLGMAFAQCQFYKESQNEFSKAAGLDPHDFEIQYNLGLSAFRNQDFSAAKSAFAAALVEQPGSAESADFLNRSRLGLAGKLFHTAGLEAALGELDGIPGEERNADYFLLQAEILDETGKADEAAKSINQAIRASPARADVYFKAEGFLLKHRLYHEALDLLEEANQVTANSKELLLSKSVALELLNREADAEQLLLELETRWPDWDRPRLLHGILLEIQLKSTEARSTLEQAIALGGETPEAYYYLARADTHLDPPDLVAAHTAIQKGIRLSSSDAFLYLLAGRISLAQKKYGEAIELFKGALKLRPNLIPAHYGLLDAYRALGDRRKAEEIEQIKRAAKSSKPGDEEPLWMEDFLFKVQPPGL